MSGEEGEGPRGKLKAVAARWAKGRGGDAQPDAATDAAAAALAEIAARRAGGMSAGEPEIGPEDWDAVRLFFSLASQWRVHAMSGVRLGLDYAAVPATAGMAGIEMTPQLFDDLRVMEGAALAAFPR